MRLVSSLALYLIITLSACGGAGPKPTQPISEEAPDRLAVFTVNYPVAYFAERLGGDLVEVVFPAPPDEDPAFWSPDAETVAAFQSADLILLNGAGYAKWVERATLPTSKLVDSSAGFADRYIELTGTVTHSHGPEGEHAHQGWAFTTWLDPTIALEQARAVALSLQTQLPDSATDIDQRLGGIEVDLQALDTRFSAAAEAIGDAPLLFSHPVYQYLIHRYELNGHQVHWEPDVEPDDKAWSELGHIVGHNATRWMLWEEEPIEVTVVGLEERGITSVIFSPCGNTPAEGDWLTVMNENAEALEFIAAQVSQ